MSNSTRLMTIALAAILLPGAAQAIGTITDGGVSFTYADFGQGGGHTTDADYAVPGAAGDHIYESWWFFRVTGDTRETALTAPDAEVYSGRYATLDWTDVAGLNLFDARLNLSVVDPGTGGGNLFQQLIITNISVLDLVIDVFHYTDFDTSGSANNDSATLGSAGPDIQIDVSDGGSGDVVPFIGYGADAYKVTPWGGFFPRPLRNDLTDGGVDDLDNSGLPFVNGDFTGAFQWSLRTIAAGESDTFVIQWGTNAPLLPPTAVPQPDTAILLGLGLAGLAWQGRRRTSHPGSRPPRARSTSTTSQTGR